MKRTSFSLRDQITTVGDGLRRSKFGAVPLPFLRPGVDTWPSLPLGPKLSSWIASTWLIDYQPKNPQAASDLPRQAATAEFEKARRLTDARRGQIQDLVGNWAQLVLLRDNCVSTYRNEMATKFKDSRQICRWSEMWEDWEINSDMWIQICGELGFWAGSYEVAQLLIDAGQPKPKPDPPGPGPTPGPTPGPSPKTDPVADAHAQFQKDLARILADEGGEGATEGDLVVQNWLELERNDSASGIATYSPQPRSAEAEYLVKYFTQIALEVRNVEADIKKREDDIRDWRRREEEARIFWADYKWYLLGGTVFGVALIFGGTRLFEAWSV